MISKLQPCMPVAMPVIEGTADINFRLSRSAQNYGLTVFPGYPGNPHGKAGWDLIVRRGPGRQVTRWVLLHELGHALGLEHPFNQADGDSWPGATIDDAVMAYASGSKLPKFRFRRADMDAITGLWHSR